MSETITKYVIRYNTADGKIRIKRHDRESEARAFAKTVDAIELITEATTYELLATPAPEAQIY